MTTTDLSYRYRARLREFLDGGSFSSDPAREKLIRRYLDEWDKWAEMSEHQKYLLDRSSFWLWFGILPGFILLIYAAVIYGRKVDQQFRVLWETQDLFVNYRAKHGASSVENEAIQSVTTEKHR